MTGLVNDSALDSSASRQERLTSDDWTRLYRENLRRFGKGEPLLNVVDKKAGYWPDAKPSSRGARMFRPWGG